MPRRLPLSVAVAGLALAVASGCADETDPAARVGDATVSHDELLSEVEAWAGSPTLLQQLQVPGSGSASGTGYSTEFVDLVLTNRVSFELHNSEFEARDLELGDQEVEEVRAGLLGDPNATAAALEELGAYGEQLVADVARQVRVQTELGEGYEAWAAEAFGGDDIEVSPRYGSWDGATGAVLAPEGPRPAPGTSTFEL